MTRAAQGDEWLVVYGSLLRRLPQRPDALAPDVLDRLGVGSLLRRVGACRFPGRLFDLGRYPAARPALEAGESIVGELYAVLDPGVFTVLDEFEGFDPQHPDRSDYLRERIALEAPRDRRAWVYLHRVEPQSARRVASGDWRAHLADRGVSPHACDA